MKNFSAEFNEFSEDNEMDMNESGGFQKTKQKQKRWDDGVGKQSFNTKKFKKSNHQQKTFE